MVGTVMSAIPERPAWLRSPSTVQPSRVSTQLTGPEEEYAPFGMVTSTYRALVQTWRRGDTLHWFAMQPSGRNWEKVWQHFCHTHQHWLMQHVAIRLASASRELPAGEWVFSMEYLSSQIPGNPPPSVLPALVEAEEALPEAQFVYLEPLWHHSTEGQRMPVSVEDFQRDLATQQTFFRRYRQRWGWWVRSCLRCQQWMRAWQRARRLRKAQRAYRRWGGRVSPDRIDWALEEQARLRRMGMKVRLESFLFDPIIAFWRPQQEKQAVGPGTALRLLAHWD